MEKPGHLKLPELFVLQPKSVNMHAWKDYKQRSDLPKISIYAISLLSDCVGTPVSCIHVKKARCYRCL